MRLSLDTVEGKIEKIQLQKDFKRPLPFLPRGDLGAAPIS